MLFKLTSVAGLALAAALLATACNTKPPKQAEALDPLSDKGPDMSTGEDSRNGGTNAAAAGADGAEKMHAKCCGECKDALAKDRTGNAPDKIPCADFTDTLDPLCREHFLAKKTMASECK
jgi:hypothetical protein